MTLVQFLAVIDRVGAPMAILIALGLGVVFGARRLVQLLGAPYVEHLRANTAFITSATQRLEAIPGNLALEAEKTREIVATEAAAVRELVTQEIGQLRDRVSGVLTAGLHAAPRVTVPPPLPAKPPTPSKPLVRP